MGGTFFWVGVGGCDIFWVGDGDGVTFFWTGMDRCDIFLGGCGWVLHFSGWLWV